MTSPALMIAIAGTLRFTPVAPPATSPTIVQIASATTSTGAASTTRTVTLTSAPTPGNVLVAILGYYQVPAGASSGAPDGTWTVWPSGELRGINAFIHSIASGDGTSYTFTLSAARNFGVVLYEIAGSNGVITASSSKTTSGGSTITLPADAGNALAIGVLKQSSQQAGGESANAGWTKDTYVPQTNGSLTLWHGTTVAGVDTTLTTTGSTSGAIGMLTIGRAP